MSSRDADSEANRVMLLELLKDCWDDNGHILSVSNVIAKRKREQVAEVSEQSLLPTMAAVSKIPDEHRIDIVVKNSSFTHHDLAKLKKEDSQVDLQIITFAFGVSACFKFQQGHRHLTVLHNTFADLHTEMGSPLKGFMEKALKGSKLD